LSPLRASASGRGTLAAARGLCQLAAFLFLAGILGCAGTQKQTSTQREAETSYKLGIAFLTEGRPAPALQELSKAEALKPDDPEILNALGMAYWARREFALAEEKLRKALTLQPGYSEAWNNLGALYISLGRYDQAIGPLENALKDVFYGTKERALANLGWALFKSGRISEAEKRLRDALQVSPGFPLAHKNLGILLAETGRHAEALPQLDEALHGLAQDPDLHLWRGLVLWKLGDRAPARASLEKAWQLGPGHEAGKSAKNYLDLLE
jgi:type IV pilus assembly protein PilF